MREKEVKVANICFRVRVIGNEQVGISVTGVSRSSNRSLLGKAFFVSDEFPYSKIYPDKRGFDGLDYTFLRTMVFDEADKDAEFNARIDVEGDKIVLRAVTQAHFLDNVLKMREEAQGKIEGDTGNNQRGDQKEKKGNHYGIRPLEDAFKNTAPATTAVNGGGTSDGGTGADMPPDTADDPRTSRRINQPALRKPKAPNTATSVAA
ncbi:MAG: hypothetical protein QG563_290 [Patescibacteria group bacterium]|nr:hypothetical protein [Patescibacteria group bacterium]